MYSHHLFNPYYIMERVDEIEKANSQADAISEMGRRHMLAPPSGILNTVTPCAACKLLRRRCAEECPFSPYFSPHEPQKFAAVHKVFGASNVSKMLLEVPEPQRVDTANSLVYEANLRLRDPVYGCMGAISSLQQQIQSLQADLTAVRTEILKYKMREATNNLISSSSNHHGFVQPGAVSIATPSRPVSIVLPSSFAPPASASAPSAPPPPPPAPPRPPPPPSIVVSSSTNPASASSLYTTSASTNTGFSSISGGGNGAYFG